MTDPTTPDEPIETTGSETPDPAPETPAPETPETPEDAPEATDETPAEAPAPEEPPGCSCGVGDKPRSYHDDDCAVWEGAYVRPEDDAPAAVEVAATAPPAPIVPGLAPDLPIIPERSEMNDLAAMAVMLANADAVPAALRQRPNDVFLVLLTARDLSVSLTTAMREFHVIEGKVTISPKSKLALVRTSGLGRIWPDPGNDAESATWHATRTDQPGERWSYTFTMDEARAITQKGKILAEKDNWRNYPKRMLSWRAVGYLLDDIFPEVGTGLYSPDELGAVTNEEGEPIEVSAVEVPQGMRNGRNGRNGNRPEAPAEEEGMDAEAAAELTARLAAVKEIPAAHEELKAWWAERSLPPARVLPRSKAGVVFARLNALETKHGIVRPDEATDAPAGGEAPQETGETDPGEVSGTFAGEPDEETPAPTPEALAHMGDLLDAGEITLWLIERAKIQSRDRFVAYAAAQGIELPEANLQGLRRWWCEREVERISLALYGPLLLAVLGTAAHGRGDDA